MVFENAAAHLRAPSVHVIRIAQRRMDWIAFVLDPEQLAGALADLAGADGVLAALEGPRSGGGVGLEGFSDHRSISRICCNAIRCCPPSRSSTHGLVRWSSMRLRISCRVFGWVRCHSPSFTNAIRA